MQKRLSLLFWFCITLLHAVPATAQDQVVQIRAPQFNHRGYDYLRSGDVSDPRRFEPLSTSWTRTAALSDRSGEHGFEPIMS